MAEQITALPAPAAGEDGSQQPPPPPPPVELQQVELQEQALGLQPPPPPPQQQPGPLPVPAPSASQWQPPEHPPPPHVHQQRGNFSPEQLRRLNVLAQKLGPLTDSQVRYIINRATAERRGDRSICSHCGQGDDGAGGRRRRRVDTQYSEYYSGAYSDYYSSDIYYPDDYSGAPSYSYYDSYEDSPQQRRFGAPLHTNVGAAEIGRHVSVNSLGAAAPAAQQWASGQQGQRRSRKDWGQEKAGSFRWNSFVDEWRRQTKRMGSDPLMHGVCRSTLARIARRQDENLRRFDALPELMEVRTSGGVGGRSSRHTLPSSAGEEGAAGLGYSYPPAHSHYTGYGLPPDQRPWPPTESSSRNSSSHFPRR